MPNAVINIPDPVDVQVGARVKLLRQNLKLSQAALAQLVGVTFQQIQKYERGTNRVSASMLTRIAEALRTTGSALLGEQPVNQPPSELLTLLAESGAVDLLNAYQEISEPSVRRALLEFAKAASRKPEAPAQAQAA